MSSCASLLALHRAEAQGVNLSDEAIRNILRRRVDIEKRATGMAVGIVEHGRRWVIVYCKQDSGDARSLLLSIRRPAPAVGGEQALGWDVVTGTDPFLAKDGVTLGQAASIVLDAPKHTGVVALSNAFPVNLQPPPDGGVGAADLVRQTLPVG